MKNFISKITAALAVAVLAVVGFGAAPAQASSIYGCPDNNICVFDGTNYGTWHWGRLNVEYMRDFPTPGYGTGCVPVDLFVDMGGSGNFDNTISSIIVNASGYGNSTQFHPVKFWMNANCNGTPVPYTHLNSGLTLDPDLSNGGFNISSGWSNAVSSISVGAGW